MFGRSLKQLLLLPGAAAIALFLIPLATLNAAEVACSNSQIFQYGFQDFCIRKKLNVSGGLKIIGNTILVAPEGSENTNYCSTYTNGPFIDNTTITSNTNAAYYLCGYKTDTSVNYENSTTSTLSLPEGAQVQWAGLYWQALGESADNSDPNYIGKDIYIKHNNDSGYTAVEPLQVFYTTYSAWRTPTYYPYSAYADITDYVKSHGEGNYTVADIAVHEGKAGGLGSYGAWTMFVIYKKYGEQFRNITVFDGYKQVTDTNDVYVTAEGFLTPKSNAINSKVFIFTAEGDRFISGDWLEVENKNSGNLEKVQNTDNLPQQNSCYALSDCTKQSFYSYIKIEDPRHPELVNNMGIDIQQYDLCGNSAEDTCSYQFMQHEQTDIGMKFTSEGDYYWPSVIAFQTDLYIPKFCYDYSYKQFNRTFTEEINTSRSPRIKGYIIPDVPVDVSLYIKNVESSDILAKTLSIDITDINTSQAVYKRDSTYVTPPGEIAKIPYADVNVSDNFDANISIGDIDSQEYFYLYYSLQPSSGLNLLDMPLKGSLHYSLETTLGGTTITLDNYSTSLEDMELCVKQPVPYQPFYSIFNIVQKDVYTIGKSVGKNLYNIPTQVSRRPDSFYIVSYDATNVEQEAPVDENYSTVVGVDMVDIGAFHDVNASCSEPTNSLGERVWVEIDPSTTTTLFDQNTLQSYIDNTNTNLSSPSDFYAETRKNVAFRISYFKMDENNTLQLSNTRGGNKKIVNFTNWAGRNCLSDVDGNPNNTDTVSQWCGDNGAGQGQNGMNKEELRKCLECVFGYSTYMICSRDNFSIRPESFFIKLSDIDQETNSSYGTVTNNSGSSSTPVNLASGYRYRLDINATEFGDISSASGYTRIYGNDVSDHNVSLVWSPPYASYNSACNKTDTSKINTDFVMYNGSTSTPWSQNVLFSSNDIGIYRLNMIDKGWTLVDQNPAHHINDPLHFIGWDCLQNSNTVQPLNTAAGWDGVSNSLNSVNGCDIETSNYSGPTKSFNDLNITFIPYKFDLSITRSAKTDYETNLTDPDKAWVYDSDISDDIGKEEAFHIVGTITAKGYDGNVSTNFVEGCYAKPISLYLDHNFTAMPTAFQFRLIDTNGSILSDKLGDINNTLKFTFLNEGNFTKNMLGSTQIRLHLNFKRSNAQPQDPRTVVFKDFNVTCSLLNDCTKYADGDNNQTTIGSDRSTSSVVYYYGRLHAPDYRTEKDSISTPIYAEVYCDPILTDCSVFNISRANGWNESVDDVNWWINPLHTEADGNITAISATKNFTILDTNVTINNMNPYNAFSHAPQGGKYDAIVRYNGNKKPHKVRILVSSDPWLKYHRFFSDGRVYFDVLFEGGSGNWAGIGNLGKTVDTNASKSSSRRIEW